MVTCYYRFGRAEWTGCTGLRIRRSEDGRLKSSCATLSYIVLGGSAVMAGPGDEIAAGAGGRGDLRASHADREQVIGTLKAAFMQGMLAKDRCRLPPLPHPASSTYATFRPQVFSMQRRTPH